VTDQLRLAKILSQKSVPQLAQLIDDFQLSSRPIDDLIDLSSLLLQRKTILPRLESLSRQQLESLKANVFNADLVEAMLADELGGFDIVLELIKKIPPGGQSDSELDAGSEAPIALLTQGLQQNLVSLRELILSSERQWLRVMRSGLRKPDAQIFSEYVHLSVEQIQNLFDLGLEAGLLTEDGDRWLPTEAGQLWLKLDDLASWVPLVEALGVSVKQLQGIQAGENIAAWLQEQYPLLPIRKNAVVRFGGILGLSNDGRATNFLVLCTEGKMPEALELLASSWLPPATRLIIQADQSVTIAGPVEASLHLELNRFTDPLDIGLASRFRINRISLTRGLESGLQADEITKRLEELSSSDLPQPVRYLIQEAHDSLQNIVISMAAGGTKIQFKDRIESIKLENDRNLNSIGLYRVGEETLASRLRADLVALALRDAGHAAIRVSESGSFRFPPRPSETADPKASTAVALATKLLSSDAAGLDDQNLNKQLQFAFKHRLGVQLTVRLASGEQVAISATVTGVSESRVRVRDLAADAERTLPISSIIDWALD
jgi:hypothetical protein